MTFDSRFDAFETAFLAWGAALQAIDRTNTEQMTQASDIADTIVLPRAKEVNTLSKRLGATKGQKVAEPTGITGARRLRRRAKTGRRARKGTRRGRYGRS
jgi:hypothetical protein